MDPLSIAIFVIILLFSVIFHEVAHGLMALRLGDPTAKYAGRLTLNPIPHLDLFGSILLPAFLAYFGLPILGAAKPVPINYSNLSNIRRDMFLVSIVGPLTNFALAFVAGIVLRITPGLSVNGADLLMQVIYLNCVLGIFNLIPIPPLDGSKILASALGYINHNLMYRILELERFSFILLLLVIMIPGFLSRILLPPVMFLFALFTGDSTTTF
ncbi:MAG: site-2 protease family protein [Candidatus Doudnabacteria bacterium]|nr:site-2 protease family protein [Candidatus Doudnabacteria bacterium]